LPVTVDLNAEAVSYHLQVRLYLCVNLAEISDYDFTGRYLPQTSHQIIMRLAPLHQLGRLPIIDWAVGRLERLEVCLVDLVDAGGLAGNQFGTVILDAFYLLAKFLFGMF